MSAWQKGSHEFTFHVQQHSFVEFGHEIISTAIHALLLIQEGQLSVTGERMCNKYQLVNCLGGLPRNNVDKLTDYARNDLKCVEGL